jgi:hypothetical protein
MAVMAKAKRELIEILCPCCEAKLQIDPVLKAVISHEEHQRPKSVEDIAAAVQKLKGEEARRAQAFEKSFEDHKSHHKVLERKFDELLKQAKENPDAPAPRKPFDFD